MSLPFIRSPLAVAALGLLAVAAIAGPGKPRSARTNLTEPASETPTRARGRLTVKDYPANGDRPARTWVRLQAWKLERDGTFTMYIDDPAVEGADFQPWSDPIAAHGNGNINTRVDTKDGATMPFGKTADELADAEFQVRDSEGIVVLEGSFPALPPIPPAE